MRRVRAAWFGVIAALIVALTVVFVIDWAPVANDGITRSVSKALGRSVTIAGPIRFRPSFSGLTGRATGIVVSSPEWARSDEFASIDTAEVTFSWLALLVGDFEPERIYIKGVLFELESRPKGSGYEATWQIGPLDPDYIPGAGGAIRFGPLPDIILEDAALAVTDPYGQLHDIAVRRFALRRKGRGASVSALLGEGESPVKLGWSVSSLKDLQTESSQIAMTLESAAGTVTASGELGFHPDAGFDLQSQWDLSALGQFGNDLGLTGLPPGMPLTASFRIAGTADAFALQLDKMESGRSRLKGVLQGRLSPHGGIGSAYNLLELKGKLASQHLDLTPAVAALAGQQNDKGDTKPTRASLVDLLFGPGLVVKLDVEVSALELAVNDTVLKNASTRVMSDARVFRLARFSGSLGEGNLALDLVMDRSGTTGENVGLLFSGRDLDLGWLFSGLGIKPLLVAPAGFGGALRAGGANTAEMLSSLTGSVHFVSGHGALRGAAARGLELSGVKLPRLEGVEALPLECLAGRASFTDGIGVLDGFSMRGSGYQVTAEGYANLGRQRIDMRFSPVADDSKTLPDRPEGVAYQVSGPLDGLRVRPAQAASGNIKTPSRPAAPRKLPALRGKVARANPCLEDMRSAQEAAPGAAQ